MCGREHFGRWFSSWHVILSITKHVVSEVQEKQYGTVRFQWKSHRSLQFASSRTCSLRLYWGVSTSAINLESASVDAQKKPADHIWPVGGCVLGRCENGPDPGSRLHISVSDGSFFCHMSENLVFTMIKCY